MSPFVISNDSIGNPGFYFGFLFVSKICEFFSQIPIFGLTKTCQAFCLCRILTCFSLEQWPIALNAVRPNIRSAPDKIPLRLVIFLDQQVTRYKGNSWNYQIPVSAPQPEAYICQPNQLFLHIPGTNGNVIRVGSVTEKFSFPVATVFTTQRPVFQLTNVEQRVCCSRFPRNINSISAITS